MVAKDTKIVLYADEPKNSKQNITFLRTNLLSWNFKKNSLSRIYNQEL
jgi:hypothetical protein